MTFSNRSHPPIRSSHRSTAIAFLLALSAFFGLKGYLGSTTARVPRVARVLEPGGRVSQEVAFSARSDQNTLMPHRRRIIDDRLYAHFVTFSGYRRRRLPDHDHRKNVVLGVLNEEFRTLV